MIIQVLIGFLLFVCPLDGSDLKNLPAPCSLLPAFSDSLTVHIFLHDECMISQYYTPALSKYYKTYSDKQVGFVGYFPNSSAKADKVKAFAEKYDLDFPLKSDFSKEYSKKFGVTVTPEVAVWDHRSDRLIYRGRIDDSYVRVGKRRLHIQHEDLKDIIDGWLDGNAPVQIVETQAIGCFINFGVAPSAPQSPKGEEK